MSRRGRVKIEVIHPKLLKAVSTNTGQILGGKFIAVDPSSGAGKSHPAYAVFNKGELVSSGRIEVPAELRKGINYTPHRLKFISDELRRLHPREYDLLVMECIHYRPNAKTNLMAFQQLNQSIGAMTSALQWKRILHILPIEWQKLLEVSGMYSKQDVMDAIQIGQAAIYIAQELNKLNRRKEI